MNESLLHAVVNRPLDRYTLENGLTVVRIPDAQAAVVSVQLLVKTGSIHEGKWLGAGISHYLEHMLFKGTQRRSFKAITADIQSGGGNVNAYTTFDRTVYYVDGPSESFASFMDVLADMAFHSKLDPEECARERNVILREIDMGRDDPDRCLAQWAFRESFRKHPYGLPIIGERSLFEKITREDLWQYYRERYAPNNMVLAIGGDVGACDWKAEVEKYFAQEPMRSVSPVLIEREPEQLARRDTVVRGDYQVARGSMAFRIPGLCDGDAPALDLLASIVGQGNSSLLWKTLHDDLELVHYIDASCWNPGEAGMFWISYVCDSGKSEQVEAEVCALLDRLDGSSVNAEALAKAQRRAVVSQVNAGKSASGMASRYACFEVVAGDIGYLKTYFNRIEKETPERLLEVAKTYLCEQRLSCVRLLNEEAVPLVNVNKGIGALSDFEEVVLPNGLRILHQQVAGLPKVHFRAVALGGTVYEPVSLKGGSALLATMLARDTQKRSAYEVAQTIESAGGTFSEFAGNNTLGLSMEVLNDDCSLACELLSDALMRPAFKAKTYALERDGQIAQILENRDEAVDCARLKLRQLFFGKHPFAYDTLGTEEALKGMTIQSMQTLYDQLIVPKNVTLAISGDFDRSALLEQVSAAFAPMRGEAFSPKAMPFEQAVTTGAHQEATRFEQTVVQAAWRDDGLAHEDYWTSELLDEIFSGMSSALFEKVRERRGLAYYIYSTRLLGLGYGMFSFCSGTTWESSQEVLEIIREEMERVAAGDVCDDELQRCRTRLKSSKRLQQQSPGARAMNAALNAVYGLPVNLWRQYDARLEAIARDDLAALATRMLATDGLTLVCSPEVGK